MEGLAFPVSDFYFEKSDMSKTNISFNLSVKLFQNITIFLGTNEDKAKFVQVSLTNRHAQTKRRDS
jgi:hypothetical protein